MNWCPVNSDKSWQSCKKLPIVNDVFNYFDQLISLGEAERFLPKTFRFVADDDDCRVIVFSLDVLAQLVECPVDVLFFARKKKPTGPCVKPLAVFFQSSRRVFFRIDADRHQERILTQAIAERILHLLKIAIHRRTNAGTRSEERVDYNHLVL